MRKTFLTLTLALCLSAGPGVCRAADVSYSREVRPILAANCLECHGQDAQKRKGELRLDDRKIATHPANGSLIAVVPNHASKSELIKRITSDDSDVHMPPAKSGKPPLSAEQIATLRQWIDQGAVYEGHWAFSAPVRPQLPPVKDTRWVRNPIDRFILSRLESQGLAPAPEADKITLIRRLSLDLIGLPSTIKEVDAFVADPSPDAYEKLVDRPARLASLWRALGPALAGCRALCRLRWIREGQAALHLVLPRLGDQRV